MKLVKILAIPIFLIVFNAIGQKTYNVPDQKMANLPNLSIGDQLPDFAISKIINTNQRTANTADYKNQLSIIDFWATSCSGV